MAISRTYPVALHRHGRRLFLLYVLATLGLLALTGCGGSARDTATDKAPITLLNVSYDPTREFYREINEAFAKHWLETTGQVVTVQQSHGGSGSQSRAVIDGLEADVVTLALAFDVDAIADRSGRLPTTWQARLPANSAPYISTLGFLVRKGNPKNIRTWDDLGRSGVQVITPNPKTSGVARWNYLAMWGQVLRTELGPDFAKVIADPKQAARVTAANAKAQTFVASVYRNVPVLDRGAREATNTFIQRHMGDVLINWENEILLGSRDLDEAGLEMVIPAVSIRAEPVVALVDSTVDRKGTRAVATAYLEFLYGETGQDIAGRNYYRPAISQAAAAKYRGQFPALELFTIDDVFGGWREANRVHFADGGTFDQVYKPQ
jgi:sulfate/thiosulfate-binding protein